LRSINPDEAETIAVAALGWIAADPERTGAFLAASGASVADLRAGAADPAFLGFVMDFLLGDDNAVIAFAEHHRCPPEALAQARAALPGGDLPHWT